MLSIKVRKDELKSELKRLTLTGDCTYNGGTLMLPMNEPLVKAGSLIQIKRSDGPDIEYSTAAYVLSNVNGLVTVSYNFPVEMRYGDLWKVTDMSVPMSSESDFLVLSFTSHCYRKNRDNTAIAASLDKDYTFDTPTKQCLDYKHFIYNEKYLYKSKDKDDDERFAIASGNCENYSGITLTYGTGLTFDNGFTPINGTHDDRNLLYFPWKDDYTQLVEDSKILTLSGFDPRYFEETSGGTLMLRDGVTFWRTEESAISVGLGEAFTHSMSIEEDVKGSYLEGRIESSVNKLIDYEKKMFEPVCLKAYNTGATGNTITVSDVDKIKFNLYFRNRSIAADDSDWYIDGAGWNRDASEQQGFTPMYGDPLGWLGFTDNDVFNRNKRFAKSFIRLSFFDSPDRKKQVLQFYSTIFFDTTEMYNRFMRNKNTVTLVTDEEYVDKVSFDEEKSLSCTFSCSSKRDTMSSSEGFYLYLFDSILEGTKPTPLYMLVEFNHAKYGKTIPMMMPRKNTSGGTEPIGYNSGHFPKGYLKATDNNNTYADMTHFYNDMFIKVYVKYDEVTGRYVWYLPYTYNSREWVFNLFEPQINETYNP